MEKNKMFAIGILAALGGAALMFKEPLQNPNAPPPTPAPVKSKDGKAVDLVGGVTALKVEDLRVGTGKSARAGDNLTMNYRGQLLSGEEFDASYGREPFQFQLGAGQVIVGWDEGIVGMKEGGKRKLTIPADKGYGARGSGEKIPGGATLVFEVELIKVETPGKSR